LRPGSLQKAEDVRIPSLVKSTPLDAGVTVLILAATVAVFYPVSTFDFLHYDDNAYITDNPDALKPLSLDGFAAAFVEGHDSSWRPLTILSHMLDVTLFGLNPGAHHVVNLVLHLANVALFFLFLSRVTEARVPSAFAAALFALHPLHVEPVAWISSRTEVLGTLFMLLTLIAYAYYSRRPRWKPYSVMAGMFVLGLLAKPMLVTLPAILLLLDFWPLGRMRSAARARKAILEKLPLVAISGVVVAVAMYFQTIGGTVKSLDDFPWDARVSNAVASYFVYLEKTLVPIRMAPYYPHPETSPNLAIVLPILTLLAGITLYSVLHARRRPYLVVGWLWFVGSLVPAIGMAQFHSDSAPDRYTYMPHMGFFIALVWLVADETGPLRWRAVTVAGAVAVGLFALVSVRQVDYWRNDLKLFSHVLDVSPRNAMAQLNMANALYRTDKRAPAIEHAREALRLDPSLEAARRLLDSLDADTSND